MPAARSVSKTFWVVPAAGVPDQLRALVIGVAAKEYLLHHLDGNPAIGLAPGYAVSCMVRAMYREDPIKPFSVYPPGGLPSRRSARHRCQHAHW